MKPLWFFYSCFHLLPHGNENHSAKGFDSYTVSGSGVIIVVVQTATRQYSQCVCACVSVCESVNMITQNIMSQLT